MFTSNEYSFVFVSLILEYLNVKEAPALMLNTEVKRTRKDDQKRDLYFKNRWHLSTSLEIEYISRRLLHQCLVQKS